MKTRLPAALLSLALSSSLFADESAPPPLLEFASGLPGKQVRLTWTAEAGLRYRVEKSTTLGGGGGGGGAGGWSQVALVDATSSAAEWLDPEPTTQKAFYRVSQPQAEVFAISPSVLSPTGGILLIEGQCLPAGSSLVLEIEGQAPMLVPLTALGGGVWRASIVGGLVPGGSVLSSAIVDSNGTTLVPLDQPITVTATGLAADSPPSLPPAAPVPDQASNPIPGVGVVIKRGSSSARAAAPGGEDCDDRDPGFASRKGYDYYQAQSQLNSAGFLSKKGYDYYQAQSQLNSTGFLSKKGYDYYQAQSALQSTGAQTNPAFQHNETQGNMPETRDLHRPAPAPSGLPGEVSFQSCDLALPCPAGPPLAWVCTYRSMAPVSSGHGPGWDFSYNISIEPIPSTAGATAPRLLVRDGGGRADVFHRQADGTYRCDGMFREGSFSGDTFTLTFADKGTWTFHPLDGSPTAGKVVAITDRTGTGLACAYDSAGQLETVSDAFGRRLAVEWGSSPARILSVTSTDATASFSYGKVTYTYAAADDKRASVSCPFVPGQPPIAGPTVYQYAKGFADPRLNDNLLNITDGSGRLLEAFDYATTAAPADLDYDTCISHDRHREFTGHVTLMKREMMPPGPTSAGGYTIFEVDEIGRLTETDCDRMHRVVRVREYTGFCTPGVPVTSTSNRPVAATKVRATDPDFFETSGSYNADSLCTRLIHADGSQERVTYQRDLDPACAVRERGNPRVMTVVASGGEMRTVSCDYLPGYGNPESARPGNPIGGLSIKGGKNPGGLSAAKERGITINTSHVEYATANKLIWSPRSNFRDIDDDCDGIAATRRLAVGNEECDNGGTDVSVQGFVVNSHTSAMDLGVVGGGDEDCDGDTDSFVARKLGAKQKCWLNCNFRLRMVNAHGQVSTWGYDAEANCTSALSPLPGKGTLYQYNGLGQCTGSTVLNGAASSFHDEYNYNATTGFLSSVVRDSTGLHLTTACDRDPQGRITRVVDPLGNDWLYTYNPLDQCVEVQSPAMPNRISMNLTIDSAGRGVRCDCAHLRPDGTPDPVNPAYSTFYIYDSRGRLSRVAEEELPVDASGLLEPLPATLASYAVCDITRDHAGQVVSLSTPAACRMQSVDQDCDFTYDERGLIHRRIQGGLGSTTPVITEYDYDAAGAVVRCAAVGAGVTSPETFYTYDGFHRLSSVTDPMGNVCTYSYANDGTVTGTVSGEVIDVPGSAGNTQLLVFRMRKRPEILFQAWDDAIDQSIGGSGTGVGPSSTPLTTLLMPALMKAKEKANRAKCSNGVVDPFFDVEVEDDTFTLERFSPGEPAPHATEITVVDRSPAGLVQGVTCNGDVLLTCTYDSAGRPATCSNGACTVAVTRNANGEVILCGETDHFRIAGMTDKTFTRSFVRDPLGRITRCTDGSGNVALFAYDSIGRRVSMTEPGGLEIRCAYDGGSAIGPFSVEVSADVDGDGDFDVLARSLVRCGGLVYREDSYGHRTSFALDALGRVSRRVHPDATFEDITFDSLGRAAAHRRKDGTVTLRDYNYRGLVTVVSHNNHPAGVVAVPPTTYDYNGLGHCTRCEQGSSLVQWTYDSLGNPLTESHNGQVVTRTFNHRGRSSVTYPDGRRFAENRDALGQVLSISALNAVGQPLVPPVVVMDYAGERVWRKTQANGMVTTFAYRGDGEAPLPGGPDASFDACVRATITNASAVLLSQATIRRDANQRESRSDTLFTSQQQAPGRSKEFTRDRLGRVTECITRRREVAGAPPIVESSVSYVLGTEGRRVSELRNGTPGTYTQDNGVPEPGDQQMDQYTTWPGGPIEWDQEGNLRSIHRSTIAHTYTHDAQGRLVSVSDPAADPADGPLVAYSYDAIGRRTSSTVGGGAGLPPVVTEFAYDGPDCIQELNDNGTGVLDPAVTFVSTGGVKHRISTRDGTIYYPAGAAESTINRRTCSCPPGYYVTGRKIEHSGDPHENLSGISLLATATGAAFERFDCDDAGKPVFLASDGVPTSASSAIGPVRWMAPEAMWEPSIGMLLGTGYVYSPELGLTISSANGHVTVLKAAAQDHNSSRSNKTSS